MKDFLERITDAHPLILVDIVVLMIEIEARR